MLAGSEGVGCIESGSNDPMAVLLTTTILGIMTGGIASAGGIAGTLLAQFILGGFVGAVIGWLGLQLANRVRFSAAGVHPILVTGLGMTTFGVADLVLGNSFLAVYRRVDRRSKMLQPRRGSNLQRTHGSHRPGGPVGGCL